MLSQIKIKQRIEIDTLFLCVIQWLTEKLFRSRNTC